MNITISASSKSPIYEQIKQNIQRHILSGELLSGNALPSTRKLAKDLRISIITTKKAYAALEKEGLIVSHVGRGSFVAPHTQALLTEKRHHFIEEKLRDVLQESRKIGMSPEELNELFHTLNMEVT